MENDLQAIVAQTETILESVSSRSDWEQAKASISGPNGALTQIAKNIGSLAKEDRPTFGQALNQAKKRVEALFKTSLQSIEEQADLQEAGCETPRQSAVQLARTEPVWRDASMR